MLEPPRTGLRDADIGIGGFATRTPPLGGRLKVRIDDFRVDEVAARPREDPRGPFVAALLRLTDWETNAFVREASARLGVSRKKIHFSGTKDKRGVTSRWFTFEAPPEAVAGLAVVSGVEILDQVRTATEVELGDHAANRFAIVLRDVDASVDVARRSVAATWQEVDALGGVPNFFGPQRFGTQRATTHVVGARMIRGDFEGAVLAYLTLPGPGEPVAARRVRADLARSRDWKAALRQFSEGSTFERSLLHRLVETNNDWVSALQVFPSNLQRLFVYAYQSWIFNRILSGRLLAGLPLDAPLVGDLVAPIDQRRILEEWIPVTHANLERVRDEVRRGRAAVTGWLPGTEAPRAEGPMGQVESSILAAEGLQPRDFLIPEHLPWSSKGTRRALLVRPAGFEATVAEDEVHPGRTRVSLAFELPPGAYATSMAREFSKSVWLEDYA